MEWCDYVWISMSTNEQEINEPIDLGPKPEKITQTVKDTSTAMDRNFYVVFSNRASRVFDRVAEKRGLVKYEYFSDRWKKILRDATEDELLDLLKTVTIEELKAARNCGRLTKAEIEETLERIEIKPTWIELPIRRKVLPKWLMRKCPCCQQRLYETT